MAKTSQIPGCVTARKIVQPGQQILKMHASHESRKIYNGEEKMTERKMMDNMSSSFSISLLGKKPLLSLCDLTLSTIPRSQLVAAYSLNRQR